MGYMLRAVAHEEEQRFRERFDSAVSICAAIVAAVRLARDQNIGVSLPRVLAIIADSVSLARNIVRRVVGG